LRTQLISGPRRKRFVLLSLAALLFAIVPLAIIVGLQESNLPNSLKLDELRLLEPQNYVDAVIVDGPQGADSAEAKLQYFADCLKDSNPETSAQCTVLLERLVQENPANGRLWLELARVRGRETGVDAKSLAALRNSYKFAPREYWIIKVRTKFALSIWSGLTVELHDLARTEILTAMSDPKFLDLLAEIYSTSPLAQAGITEILPQATVDQQHNFLGLLRRKATS
jgi:hypothetical protein